MRHDDGDPELLGRELCSLDAGEVRKVSELELYFWNMDCIFIVQWQWIWKAGFNVCADCSAEIA